MYKIGDTVRITNRFKAGGLIISSYDGQENEAYVDNTLYFVYKR